MQLKQQESIPAMDDCFDTVVKCYFRIIATLEFCLCVANQMGHEHWLYFYMKN